MPCLGLPLLSLLLLADHFSPARPCYFCFTSAKTFCNDYMNEHSSSCWQPITDLMMKKPVYWLKVAPSDFNKLKSIYSRALRFIRRRRSRIPTEPYVRLLTMVEIFVLDDVYKLKTATPCNQICGINPAATYFDCAHCRMRGCSGIPFSCPIEDMAANETGHVSMKCQASFNLPKIDSVIWRIVPKIRSDIIQQFKVFHVGNDDTVTINNVKMKNSGTYACDVISKDTILLRRFFHLTVIHATLQGSKDLQVIFQKVLGEEQGTLKPPVAKPLLKEAERLRKQTETQLTAAIALAAFFFILGLGGLYRWVS